MLQWENKGKMMIQLSFNKKMENGRAERNLFYFIHHLVLMEKLKILWFKKKGFIYAACHNFSFGKNIL